MSLIYLFGIAATVRPAYSDSVSVTTVEASRLVSEIEFRLDLLSREIFLFGAGDDASMKNLQVGVGEVRVILRSVLSNLQDLEASSKSGIEATRRRHRSSAIF